MGDEYQQPKLVCFQNGPNQKNTVYMLQEPFQLLVHP